MKLPDDPRLSMANVSPPIACSVLNVARDAGFTPERLCKGLGFSPIDLTDPNYRLSYRQIKELVQRTQDALGNVTLGLISGARQTPLSWGLVGVAMMSCPTFAESARYGIEHQNDAGALLTHDFYLDDRTFTLEVRPRFPDPEFEAFLVEDALASVVSVTRTLLGTAYRPKFVEVAYKAPKNAKAYTTHLHTEVRFNAGVNRLVSDLAWLDSPISSYDPFTCGAILTHINGLLPNRTAQIDVVESVKGFVLRNADRPMTLDQIAGELCMSGRTLRRRLLDQGVNFRELAAQVRQDYAIQLLHDHGRKVSEISEFAGFRTASSFTRAFKRWTGTAPSRHRKG